MTLTTRIFSCLLLIPGIAAAQSTSSEFDGHSLDIGLVAISASSVYRGGDMQTRAFPAINYRYKRFFVEGNELGFDLLGNDQWEVRVGLGTDLAGDVDRGDSDELEDLPGLSLPVSAFVSAQYTSSIGQFRLAYGSEINNKHEGDQLSFRYRAPFSQGRWLLVPSAEVTSHSDEVVDYFYGVGPASATPTRPAYQADSERVIQLGMTAIRPINDRWTFFGNFSWQSLGDEIADSPIVDDNDRLGLFVGVTWKVF